MTDIEDLSFKAEDPGAVRHGNFINYYSFHSPDIRINNLDSRMFPSVDSDVYICLDIGCNSGDLTVRLYKYLQNIFLGKQIYIVAIDIDPNLIERAKSTFSDNSNITFESIDIMNEDSDTYLNSILFLHKKQTFDMIFCFSVTMWIHLNKGDKGLKDFIHRIKHLSAAIIVEAQPWKCYTTAVRRMKRANECFPKFDSLQIRKNVEKDIENLFLSESTFYKVLETSQSEWKRKLLCFRRTKIK